MHEPIRRQRQGQPELPEPQRRRSRRPRAGAEAGTAPNPDQSSAFYVYRSTGSNGASWNFPGRPVAEHNDVAGAGDFLLDKQLLTVDNSVTSRFRDRVYGTWTQFDADGPSYIYEAHSADYGETFSTPHLVSTTSAVCDTARGLPTPFGACNTNQFSQPFTALDSTLYVAYANFNNVLAGSENHAGTTGTLPVPEKGPSFNSINRNSNESNGCTPAGIAPDGDPLYTGVKTGGCNNDIVLSVSTDGGASFANPEPRTLPVVNTAPGQAKSDQFWQGAAYTRSGVLAVTYYDRQYGADNNIGFSDITVSQSRNLTTFRHDRATSSSMPPPTEFAGTFYGDYIAVAVTNRTAYPVWSDTRPVDLFLCPGTGTPTTPPAVCQAGAANASVANDEDIYTTAVPIR